MFTPQQTRTVDQSHPASTITSTTYSVRVIIGVIHSSTSSHYTQRQSLHLNKLVPLIKVTQRQQLLVQHIPSVSSSVSFTPAHLNTQRQSLHLNKLARLI